MNKKPSLYKKYESFQNANKYTGTKIHQIYLRFIINIIGIHNFNSVIRSVSMNFIFYQFEEIYNIYIYIYYLSAYDCLRFL